jgi:polar amino acid transport system substrate-binding protein
MALKRRELRSLGMLAAAVAVPGSALAQTAGSAWEAIGSRKVLRVGVQQAEPWYAKDLATGTWTGVGALLGEQIASDMGCTASFVETTFGNAPAALQADQFDIMFVLDPTPARALAIDFPFAPMLYYALAYITKDALGPKSWAELDTLETSIAVPIGTSMDRWLTAHMKKAVVTRLKTNDEAILHYQSGHSKLLVLYHPALIAFRLRSGQGTVIVPKPAVTSVAGAGIRREADKTWRDYLTAVMTFYYENGTIEDIYRTYLVKRGMDPAMIPGITKESLERG